MSRKALQLYRSDTIKNSRIDAINDLKEFVQTNGTYLFDGEVVSVRYYNEKNKIKTILGNVVKTDDEVDVSICEEINAHALGIDCESEDVLFENDRLKECKTLKSAIEKIATILDGYVEYEKL